MLKLSQQPPTTSHHGTKVKQTDATRTTVQALDTMSSQTSTFCWRKRHPFKDYRTYLSLAIFFFFDETSSNQLETNL